MEKSDKKISVLERTIFNSQKICSLCPPGGGDEVDLRFISTWNTANTSVGSSTSTQVSLPLVSTGTYNFTVNWGDGNSDIITAWNQSEVTHTYSSSGTYTITITQNALNSLVGWQFNNGGDRNKITDIENWGALNISTSGAFYGCENLDISALDAPTISATDMTNAFRLCNSLTTPNFSLFDTSSVTNWTGCFRSLTSFNGNLSNWAIKGNAFRMFDGCTAYTGFGANTWNTTGLTSAQNMLTNCALFAGDISNIDMSSCTNITNMLFNCDAFDYSLANWDWTAITTANGFMQNATGLSTANYDATLVGIEAQAVNNNVTIHFGGSTYTAASAAATARAALIADHTWTITDGGTA